MPYLTKYLNTYNRKFRNQNHYKKFSEILENTKDYYFVLFNSSKSAFNVK